MDFSPWAGKIYQDILNICFALGSFGSSRKASTKDAHYAHILQNCFHVTPIYHSKGMLNVSYQFWFQRNSDQIKHLKYIILLLYIFSNWTELTPPPPSLPKCQSRKHSTSDEVHTSEYYQILTAKERR